MKVAIMGFGTIGSGVYKVLTTNEDVIAKRVGEKLEVKYVLDRREFPGEPWEKLVVGDYNIIANDPDVDIVVETMGGVEPAYTFVKAMLEAGKHVTTSNKALVADKGADLIKTARDNNVNFLFEASVGGGIPIIRPILECLTGDVIEEISGIVNGTTNFILTKMTEEGSEFDVVLKEAQNLGYAEKDPTADIEGHDAQRKIAILTSLVCGQQVEYTDIPTEGISHITANDIKYAKKINRNIKLLATSTAVGDTYVARVAPYLLAPEHPLFAVNDVFNAIFVHGNMLGDGMFYGSGAGSLPTASAVVGDIVEMAKHKNMNIPLEWKSEKKELADSSVVESAFFVRTKSDKDAVKSAFGNVEFVEGVVDGEVGFTTDVMTEAEYESKASTLDVVKMIRVR
ncbi:MAG: homoserine dehydrogenase [Lachnospiraceae bacterium]|nr:homoserine dehydrogenase [Lachnospiraceae bacterium]